MTNIDKKLDVAISDLMTYCINDYVRWSTNGGAKKLSDYCKKEVEKGLGFKVKKGSKYIKILREQGSQESVWGFIVANEKDKKFQLGDILMAAGWRGPARNKARGNVLSGDYNSRWTGPNYLN